MNGYMLWRRTSNVFDWVRSCIDGNTFLSLVHPQKKNHLLQGVYLKRQTKTYLDRYTLHFQIRSLYEPVRVTGWYQVEDEVLDDDPAIISHKKYVNQNIRLYKELKSSSELRNRT